MKPTIQPASPEGPAKLQDDHVQDRHVQRGAGKMAWRRLPPHERAFRLKHLFCKEQIEIAKDAEIQRGLNRMNVWHEFTEKWLVCQAPFPGGSDYNRVRAVGIPGSFCDHQIDTKRFMEAVRTNLGARDWMLLRRVCGEGSTIAAAVVDISPSYRDSTLARFRESLDAAIEAFESARRN